MTPTRHPVSRLYHFLGSVQMALGLLTAGAVMMAVGKVIASREGRELALESVYRTGWFDAFLVLLAVNLAVAVLRRMPMQRHQWPFALTHAAIILLLGGVLVSRSFCIEGLLAVTEGGQSSRLVLESGEILLSRAPVGSEEAGSSWHEARPLPRFGLGAGIELPAMDDHGPAVTVLEYLPRGLLRQDLRPAPGAGPPGVRLRLGTGAGASETWLMAGDPEHGTRDLGALVVGLSQLDSADRLGPAPTVQVARLRAWVIPVLPPVVLDLPQDLGREVEAGDARTRVCVTRFLRRARVVAGALVEASGGTPNPAAVVEVRRDGGVETHTVFGRLSAFSVSQGRARGAPPARVRMEGVWATGRPRVDLLVDEEDRLFAQLTDLDGRHAARPLAVGETLDEGVPGQGIQLQAYLPMARLITTAIPAPGDGSEGAPCLNLALGRGEGRRTFWLARGTSRPVEADGRTLRVGFRRQAIPLPFAVTLDRFQVGGVTRPARIESQLVCRSLDDSEMPRSALVTEQHPLDYMGFRLVQSDYRAGAGGVPATSILAVSRDPAVTIVYLGFVLLIMGVGWQLLVSGRRQPVAAQPLGLGATAAERPVPAVPRSRTRPPTLARRVRAATRGGVREG